MTKVSWKRILQRAGNDLPSHGRPFAERPHLQAVARSGPRPVLMDEAPSQVAGELESELRRALQRAQATTSHHEPQDQGWDPIFMAQELRHNEPVSPVPAAHYIQTQAPRRRSSTARTLIAVSLSAVVVGVAVQQLGSQWGSETEYGGGGGGGGNGDGTEYRSTEHASLGAVTKDPGKLVQTGYAIQPIVHPGNPTDLSPVEEAPRGSRLMPQQDTSDEAAAMFRRDMEEARKLFDRKDEPAPAVNARAAEPARTPEPAVEPEPEPAPAQIAAVAPSRIVPPAQKTAPAQQAPAGPPVSGVEEGKLMQRASDLMHRGDITGARLLFEHLARRGSAIGAFALAQSYDQKYLQKMYVRGLTPDQKQADYWYRKAAELGGTTAMEGVRSGR